MEQCVAMDKLRELVADFSVDNDPLTSEEVDSARALLRYNRGRSADSAA